MGSGEGFARTPLVDSERCMAAALTCTPSLCPLNCRCNKRTFPWIAEQRWQRRWTWRACRQWVCWRRSSRKSLRSQTQPVDNSEGSYAIPVTKYSYAQSWGRAMPPPNRLRRCPRSSHPPTSDIHGIRSWLPRWSWWWGPDLGSRHLLWILK